MKATKTKVDHFLGVDIYLHTKTETTLQQTPKRGLQYVKSLVNVYSYICEDGKERSYRGDDSEFAKTEILKYAFPK